MPRKNLHVSTEKPARRTPKSARSAPVHSAPADPAAADRKKTSPSPGRRLFLGDGALPYDAIAACRALVRADPELGRWMKEAGPFALKVHRPATTFAALAESIVYQQLTGKAAATIFARVLGLFPGRRALRAADVAAATDELLRSAGLSRAKSAAMRDLAEKTLSKAVPSLQRLARMHDREIIDALIPIRGIGPWTVQMLLIFKLGRPDVLPVDDYAIRKGFARIFGLQTLPTTREVAARGELWRPYRSVASWYLWHANSAPPSERMLRDV
ncbi:MAG: DNA-3-methyladenine glycosylase 2 family protein [Myxococcales bacterium]|nr:DNA-3-methyladenine glycosylase 2 family protein [Myxococcales bacterium]